MEFTRDSIPELLAELVFLALELGRHDDAAVIAAGLADLAPDCTAPYLLAGLVCFARGNYRQAERIYHRILAAGDNPLAAVFMAEALVAQARFTEARRIIQAVIAAGRDPAAVNFARALQAGMTQGLFR